MLATENWDFRNRKFRLQAYWAETRTPGAGNLPRVLRGGPRFWPFSVLCLNSEPISKQKKKVGSVPLPFGNCKIKSPLAKSLFLLWALLQGFLGKIYLCAAMTLAPHQLLACLSSGGRWGCGGGGGDNTLVQIVGLTRKLAGKHGSGGQSGVHAALWRCLRDEAAY